MNTAIFTAEAQAPLARSERVLSKLCRHFAHKIAVELDLPEARLEFAEGCCRLRALADGLNLRIAAGDSDGRQAIVETLERHLPQFAGDAPAALHWRLAP